MSDTPQGAGWWQASDGKWYAPEQRAAATPPTESAPATPPGPGWWQASDGEWYPPPRPDVVLPPLAPAPPPVEPFDPRKTMVTTLEKPKNILVIRANGRPHAFVPPATPVIGRDEDCDVTLDNPRVSRHHARATFDGTQWVLDDTNSSAGTFVNGQRQARIPLAGEQRVWLGPVGEGGELEITAPGSAPTPAAPGSTNRTLLLALAAFVVLVLLAGLVIFAVTRSSGNDVASDGNGGAPPTTALDVGALIGSVVYVDIGGGHGSGSIISNDGLILTNAHVAAPNAIGQAVARQIPGEELAKPAEKYDILIAKGEGQPAEKAYQAELLAADGYLDLAVLQIVRDADGNDIDRATLKLPALTIGDSKTIKQAEQIRAIGFPGISGTKSITITQGEVAGFVEDQRLDDNRAWMNTSANIAGGNSGGAAVDKDGRLVGVPTSGRVNAARGESINRLRSIHLAEPVIAAARLRRDNPNGEDYVSPHVVDPTGDERIAGQVTVAAPARKEEDLFEARGECESSSSGDLKASDRVLGVSIPYEGFAQDQEDVLVAVVDESGKIIGASSNAKVYDTPLNGSGCFVVTVPLEQSAGARPKIVVFVGGNYDIVKG